MNVLARLLAAPLRLWVCTYADVHDGDELADAADRLAAEADMAGDPAEAAHLRTAAHLLACTGENR